MGALTLLTACAGTETSSRRPAINDIAPFSSAKAGGAMPAGWEPWVLSRFKRNTLYKLVTDASHAKGGAVLEAFADQSASGLKKSLDVDPAELPWINWQWRVNTLIAKADNTRREREDSPVRIVVTFDGDVGKLDFEERAISARAQALTGQAMPYATLMYIWENKAPVGAVIDSHHTSRVKMIVVASGPTYRGQWMEYSRNVAVDFERAFGEKPGRIKAVGVLTDTDNTGEKVTAYYGDIRLAREQSALMQNPADNMPRQGLQRDSRQDKAK
jgi:Protein of unknown function (DUF3047)